jgi:hypothetical protein
VDTTSFELGDNQEDNLNRIDSDFPGPEMLRIRSSYSKLKERFWKIKLCLNKKPVRAEFFRAIKTGFSLLFLIPKLE